MANNIRRQCNLIMPPVLNDVVEYRGLQFSCKGWVPVKSAGTLEATLITITKAPLKSQQRW